MAITKTDNDCARKERVIVMYLITSTRFCQKLFEQYREVSQYFQTVHGKKVSKWCEDYYGKYQKSPKVAIREIFADARELMEENTSVVIEDFLDSISSEFEREEKRMNSSYVFDIAEDYFEWAERTKLRNVLSDKIVRKESVEFQEAIEKYLSSDRKRRLLKWENPFDKKVIIETFKEMEYDKMFTFPGMLGAVLGNLQRGQLVAIRGKSGVGKSYWMMEFALHAIAHGYNVAFVSLEMTLRQIKQRIYCYLTGDIVIDGEEEYGEYGEYDEHGEHRESGKRKIIIPIADCKHNQSGECKKDIRTCRVLITPDRKVPDKIEDANQKYKICLACRKSKDFLPAIWKKAIRRNTVTADSVMQRYDDLMETRMFPGNLRLMNYPSGTVTIQEFENDLSSLERTGFISDLIVTDYADKFKMSVRDNPVQQIAHIWEVHKAVAVKKKNLVVTGSQENKKGEWKGAMAKEELIDIGIHLEQSDDDKKQGIMNFNVEKHRSRAFLKSKRVKVLYSYNVGRPYLDSFISYKKEAEKESRKK